MHNDHTIVGGARPNARAANQNNPGYTIKKIDNIDNFHDVTRNIIDNVIEAFQNYNQGVKYYVFLDVEFKKMLEDTITDPPTTFRTEMYRLLRRAPNDINDQATQIRETLNNGIDTFIQNGSGWVLNKFGRMQVKMFDYRPMAGGGGISAGFFQAPEWFVAKNEIVNVQNTDEKCFLWSILAALYPAVKNVARVTKYKPYEHELDTSCLKFPVNPGNETMLVKSPPTSPIRSQSPWSPLLSPVPPIYPPLQTPITISSDEEEEVLHLHNLHNLLTNLHNTTSTTSSTTTKRQ
eukprot:gene17815-9503_t